MNKKILTTLTSVVGVFVVLAFLVGKVYKEGQNRPPLIYSDIPESTLDFILRLADLGGDLAGVELVVNGPFDWENEKDLGQTDEKWSREEDDYFIVYYKKDKEAEWQGYAQNVLKAANDNIMPLTRLMGKYYYPMDINERKLPIYLTTTVDEYFETISSISEKEQEPNNSIGITISQIGRAGCKSSIILHPICFSPDAPPTSNYVFVLMHEMNHFILLSSVDYSKDIELYNWEIEGIANYCASDFTHLHEKIEDSLRIEYIKEKCLLTDNFPEEIIAQYWAGESYFYYMEKAHGKNFLKKFLRESYTRRTKEAFAEMKINQEDEHTAWVEYLKKGGE